MHSGYVKLVEGWHGNLNEPFSIGMCETNIGGHLDNYLPLLNPLCGRLGAKGTYTNVDTVLLH